jgi:hypothetical protein
MLWQWDAARCVGSRYLPAAAAAALHLVCASTAAPATRWRLHAAVAAVIAAIAARCAGAVWRVT